jgi:ketosteroid isomerase-like protein
LARALRAGIDRDRQVLAELLTDDVTAWTPMVSATSFGELLEHLDQRDEAFSEIDLEVAPLDVGGDYACVEWSVVMTHTGPLALGDAQVVDPTGLRVRLNGVTVAEFRGERICSLRQYWDESGVLDQLGVLRPQD